MFRCVYCTAVIKYDSQPLIVRYLLMLTKLLVPFAYPLPEALLSITYLLVQQANGLLMWLTLERPHSEFYRPPVERIQ